MEFEVLDIKDLKIRYNHLLLRIERGNNYLKGVSDTEVDRVLPHLEKLIATLDSISRELKKRDYKLIGDEIVNGFKN